MSSSHFSQDGPVDEIAKVAAIKVTREIRTSRHCMFPMEGRGVVAYRDLRLRYLTLITSTQFPHSVQTGLCECLGLDDGAVRIISPDVGGGFGYKGLLCREEVALGWLALQVNHPVRWLEDCREHLSANANCREHHYDITGYASRDGKLLAIDCVGYVDAGAYSDYPISSAPEAAQITNLLPGPYNFAAYRCRSAAVATNKCPIIPYRGVARSGVCLAIEVVMDAIAREAGTRTVRVRLRNMVRPDQMPFDNVVGKHFDSGDHPECLRRAVEAIRLPEVRARQKKPEPDGRLIGVGLSFFVEQGAHGTSVLASWGRPIVPGYEQANVRLTADGDIEIRVGTHSHGQGHETTFAQVAHEILGVDFDRIKVLQGDTLYTPYLDGDVGVALDGDGRRRGGARLPHGGGTRGANRRVAAAGRRCGRQSGRRAAWLPETAVLRCARSRAPGICSRRTCHPMLIPAASRSLRATAPSATAARSATPLTPLSSRSIPQTGLIEILDYVVVEDGGVLVNPMIVDGQVCGGTAQGIGTCLYEAMPFDAQGQPLASTLLDYMLPGPTEVPDIRILHMETPSPYTEFGMKGLGEGGAVGPPAAIVSAVNDALRPLGVEVHDLPLTPGMYPRRHRYRPRAIPQRLMRK